MHKYLKLVLLALTILTCAAGVFSTLPLLDNDEPATIPTVLLTHFWPFAICALLLFWASNRRDLAPDFLRKISPVFFEQNGLGFVIRVRDVNAICHLEIYYQNQHVQPCEALIEIRSSEEIFPGPDPYAMRMSFSCDKGAYGVTSLPWGIPTKFQGTITSFNLSAVVKRPHGYGPTLRFRSGESINPVPRSGDTVKVFFAILTVHPWALLEQLPVKIALRLPSGVSTPDDEECQGELRNTTLWRYGDAAGTLHIT